MAIVLDAALQTLRARPNTASAERHEELVAVPAVSAVKPSIVPREGAAVQTEVAKAEVTPVQETRPPRRSLQPPPPNKEIDLALRRHLSRRGLDLEDLEWLGGLKPAAQRLKNARAEGDGREVERILEELGPAIETAPLTDELMARKLERMHRGLTELRASLDPARYEKLETKYLDAKSELSRTTAAQLEAYWAKLSGLLREIERARRP